MKKRILSILLLCCMVLTMLPTAAFAAGGAVRPAATQYTYTLHYDANGGSGAPPSQSVTSTEFHVWVPISEIIPTRDGYTFMGWANYRTGKPIYGGNGGYTSCLVVHGSDMSTTIYAIWEAHDHSWGKWTSNGNGTHTRTCATDSSHTETGSCSGGKATGTEKAICETCHTAYGELLQPVKTVITTPPTLRLPAYVGNEYTDRALQGGEAKAESTGVVVPGTFRFRDHEGGRVHPGENRMVILFTPDDTEAYTTAECIITVMGTKRTITRVPDDVYINNKPLGTAFEDLGLPSGVKVETNTGASYSPVPVTWDGSTYDPNIYGEQIITGELHVERSSFTDDLEPTSTVKATARITLIDDRVFTPTLEPPTYSRQIYSGDFCQLAFSDEYLSGGKATANGETVDGVFTLNEEQEKYGYWHSGGGLVQVGLLALKVTFTPYDRLRFSTAECTVNVDVIPRKFRQANTSYIDNKKIGTAFEDLGLPNAFYFFAAADEPNHEGSGLNGNVPGIIKWDDSNYDPNSYEEQTIYGEVNRAEFEKYYIVPEGADLRGVVKITLQADPVETEITQPPVFRWKNGDFTLPDNTMFVNRIFEMGATGGGSANLADGVAKVKGTDTVVPGTFSFKEGTPGRFDELGENVVTVVFTPTDQHGYRTAETTIKVNVIKNTFKRCEEPDPITEKKLGTTFAGLNLPEIVVVEAIDGLRVGMEVSWDESSYDAQSTAWQTIPGTLVFDANDEHRYQQPEPAVTAAIQVKLLGSEDAPAITTTTLPGDTVGTPYHHQLQATGGGFILWELFSGALPDGLTLKQTTGEISGTPTAVGTATFTVKAENSVGSATKELSITITKPQQYGRVSMDDYVYGETPSTPSLTDRTGDGSVTYYYSTTNSNSGGTKWENIQAGTLNAGTYYMYAKLGETENYGSFTTACVKFQVLRAMPTCTKPTGLTAIYGQTLADVTLPDGWSWMNSSESVGNASTAAKKFKAKFTPADTTNYNTVEDIELEVMVNKANQAPLTIQGADSVVYGQTLTLTTTGGSGMGAVTYRIDTAYSTGGAAIDPNTGVLTPAKVGSVSVVATKAGDNDYNDITSAPFVLMIKPATPTGEPKYTKITTSGKTLKDAALTTNGSTLNPNDGKLEWVDDKGNALPDDTKVEANKTYKWRFMPTDTNYTPLTGEIELYHKSGGGGGYNPPVTYYTLRFETGGGSDIPSVREAYNAYIDLTGYVPTWRGHTFIGWYSERGLTNKVSGVYLTKDMTVYAGWRVGENPNTGANPFTDVSEKDWFYGDVMFVCENGLMLGTSKTLFSPYGMATRGMIATILWRMEGSPAPKGKNGFTDVEAGKWYADAVTWTAENGIFAGYGKDKFGPDDPITREQLAAIFYRYADYKGYDLTAKGNLDTFKDADKITDYAKTAMQWAVSSGLVKGKSGNLLDPQGTATRAEIAAMLHRFIEKYELVQGKAPGGLMGWIDPKHL